MEPNVFLLLLVFVLVTGSKMQRNKVDSSESFRVVAMFMLETKESPESTSKEFQRHRNGGKIRWQLKRGTRLRGDKRLDPHKSQNQVRRHHAVVIEFVGKHEPRSQKGKFWPTETPIHQYIPRETIE